MSSTIFSIINVPSIPPDKAVVAPFTRDDRIYLGEGLVETLRVIDRKPCYPALHWQRLLHAAAQLHIPITLAYDEWLQRLEQCLRESLDSANGIKVLLSGGRAARGLLSPGCNPQWVLTAFHYSRVTTPLTLRSSSWRRDRKNPVYQLKSINYLEAIMARREGASHGADDVLFFNTEGHATETTIANLFMVTGNCLYTSPAECGLLAGIMRQRIIAKACDWGITCRESPLTQPLLDEADALFVCNALQGMRRVQQLNETRYDIHHPLLTYIDEKLSDDALR